MKVAGLTSQQEVMVGSRDHNFRINEYLMIQDPDQGDILGEVIEARTYNRFIPMDIGGDFVDDQVIKSLRTIGYDIDEETIYLAKVRFFNESLYPVLTGSDVRIPDFGEVKEYLVPTSLEGGLLMGVIRNTADLAQGMEEDLKGLVHTFEGGKLQAQREVPYLMDIRSMHQYPHIGVFGGSGSGKSFGLRVLLEEFMKKGIPGIVLDPHYEMSFSLASPEIGQSFDEYHQCFQIGRDIGVRFEDISAGDLKNLLGAMSPLTDSMNNVVDVIFQRGNSYYSFSDKVEDLLKGQEEGSADKIQARISYADSPEEAKKWSRILDIYERYNSKTAPASVRGISWRLANLHREGIFNKDSKMVEEVVRLGKLAVIQGSARIIQVYSTYLLRDLYQKRRDYKDARFQQMSGADFFPPFFIITDESHNFAPKSHDSPSKYVLKEISQEGRKYGVFLVLATQRPTLLDETITAQLNTKMIFRTVRASDIDTIREETDLSIEETRRLPYLRTGDVFISSSQLGRTTYGRIRAALTESPHKENPFDELFNIKKEGLEDFYHLIEEFLPIDTTTGMLPLAQRLEAKTNKTTNISMIEGKLSQLVQEGYIDYETTFLGTKRYKKREG